MGCDESASIEKPFLVPPYPLMKTETCLEVQALVDGELDARRSADVIALCANNAEAQALRDTLQNVRNTLQQTESQYRLTESREFYWSQIQRRIQAAEAAPSRETKPLSLWSGLLRWLVPTAGLAAIALALTLRVPTPVTDLAYNAEASPVTSVEYRSDTDGVTVHWIN